MNSKINKWSYFLQGLNHVLDDTLSQSCDFLDTLFLIFALQAFLSTFWYEKQLELEWLNDVANFFIGGHNTIGKSIGVASAFCIACF